MMSRAIGRKLAFLYCQEAGGGYNLFVPLTDDFGDWATPKKPLAGRFFCAHSPVDALATLPRLKLLSAGAE